jgi:hypothetical protein
MSATHPNTGVSRLAFLRISPEFLSKEAAVFPLELTDNLLPGHSGGIIINGIKERQGFELEGQNVGVINETSSDEGDEVSWSKSRTLSVPCDLNSLGPKEFNILSGFLKEAILLEFLCERTHRRCADLLDHRNDSRAPSDSSVRVPTPTSFSTVSHKSREMLFMIASPALHLR